MHWILQFIVKHRNASSLSLTVLLSVWMLASPHQQQLAITRTLVLSIFYPVQLTLDIFTRVTNIFAENHKLRQQVTQLNTRLGFLEEASRENQRLRHLLDFAEQAEYDLVPVRVIGREPSDQYRSIVINAGKNRGLERYMPLVDNNGLAGRTLQILPHISLVQLLRDPSNRTSVLLTRARTAGILETENGLTFSVRVRAWVEVIEGDTLVTSGLGGVYPKGILVGTVSGFAKDDDRLFKRVLVKTAVNFSTLEEAFVIKMSPQWRAFAAEADSIEYNP